MTPTPVGLLLLPVGLALFLLGSRWLFIAVVISVQFFFVKALDAQAIGTQISPTELFGGLLIVRKVVDLALTGRMPEIKLPGWRMLLLFLAVVALSLFMPRLLAGRVVVVAGETTYKEYVYAPLRFRMTNITQLIFPLFMVTLLLAMRSELRDRDAVRRALRISFVSALAVLGSGLIYQFGFALGQGGIIDRFFWFFTGSPAVRELGYQMGKLPRMFSLAGEPGYSGAYFLYILGFVGVAAFVPDTDAYGWSKRRLYVVFAAMVVGIILSGGTTGIVGLALFGGFVAVIALLPIRTEGADPYAMRRVATRVLGGLAVLVVVVVALFPLLANRSFLSWFVQVHLAKLAGAEEGSGDQRLKIIFDALDIFSRYPILGVGYGSHRVSALMFSLLANTGIIGTTLFLGFNGAMLLSGIRVYLRARDRRDAVTALGACAALVSFLGVALIAKGVVTFLFGYYWLLLAVIAALSSFAELSPPAPAPRRELEPGMAGSPVPSA